MHIIQCDFCDMKSVIRDSWLLPEGWAAIVTREEGIDHTREHLCPDCRDNLMVMVKVED